MRNTNYHAAKSPENFVGYDQWNKYIWKETHKTTTLLDTAKNARLR